MKRVPALTGMLILFAASVAVCRQIPDVPTIEPIPCPIRIDSTFITESGCLIVPENRSNPASRKIKLPFIIVRSKNPNKRKDPYLFTTGGPGGSSLNWAAGMTKSIVIKERDCIAFEQRGTRYAVPNLWSNELDSAIRTSYRKNLNKDSMVIVGVRRYREALEARGIDLSGYNTDESISDIDDLLKALGIDSVNLTGGSYSGGLMMGVLQRDPSRIRSLVLASPLPLFVPVDEDEPANFNESLDIIFRRLEADSAKRALYGDLRYEFRRYFTSIIGKVFTIRYLEKGTKDTIDVQYTKNELLDAIENMLFDANRIKDIPAIIADMINGNHYPYVKRFLDRLFEHYNAPLGMRIAVYCSDEAAYHDERTLQQLYEIYPYMQGYHINDVYKPMCDCWGVPPVNKEIKRPFYTLTPALLAEGELDNACRPLYIDMIHHYMPNSQRLLFRERSHGTGGSKMQEFVQQFLDNPLGKLTSSYPEIIAY